MHIFPFISSFTRWASSVAAIPFGCLSVLVTWLNLTTISPSSQAAMAACATMANVIAAAAAAKYFMLGFLLC